MFDPHQIKLALFGACNGVFVVAKARSFEHAEAVAASLVKRGLLTGILVVGDDIPKSSGKEGDDDERPEPNTRQSADGAAAQ